MFLGFAATAQTNCGVDTINYTYYKTTQFRGVSLNASSSGNSFAQWYPAPQAITVEGFDFYAWQSAGTNASVTLTCNIFRAGIDSLPTGAPLRSVTVNVDSTFGSGQLTTLIKRAIFSSPITLTVPYVLTVENSTATNVSVLANDYAAANGQQEWLSSVRIGANYLRGYSINVGGISFDADFIFRPHVKYTLTSDFTFAGCNSGGNTITFTNKSSDILSSRFYNRYAFYSIEQFCYLWNYGDTTGSSYSINGMHSYANRVDHEVSLRDTLYGWFVGCGNTKTKTVYATPNAPNVNNTGPVCSGDSVRLYLDTIPGATYIWGGPKGFLTNSPDTVFANSDTSLNGKYAAVAFKNGCPSAASGTIMVINQTPQTPIATNDGSKCVGDTSVFTASSGTPSVFFNWEGPNGFMSTSNTFSFEGVDTTLRGSYRVFVDDGICKSAADTVDLYVYPPPQAPMVGAQNTTVCERDSLILIGNSVPGAVFSWEGPNGFKSADTNPVITNANAIHAGQYKAYVIIGSCSSTADSVAVGINPSPTATVTVANNTFCDGDSALVDGGTTAGLTYQWQQNSADIANATTSTVYAKTTGDYRLVVTNTFMCSDTSAAVPIVVKPLPTINQHPATQLVRNGWDATFSIVSPDAGATYQWQEDKGAGFANLNNTAPYAGATSAMLTISGADANFHSYQYRCVVTLAGCISTSNAGVLTINISVGEISNNLGLKVYPNPANSILNIGVELDEPQTISYSVVDVLGKQYIVPVTFMADAQQVHTIGVEGLAKGVYFLKIKTQTAEKTIRFTVE